VPWIQTTRSTVRTAWRTLLVLLVSSPQVSRPPLSPRLDRPRMCRPLQMRRCRRHQPSPATPRQRRILHQLSPPILRCRQLVEAMLLQTMAKQKLRHARTIQQSHAAGTKTGRVRSRSHRRRQQAAASYRSWTRRSPRPRCRSDLLALLAASVMEASGSGIVRSSWLCDPRCCMSFYAWPASNAMHGIADSKLLQVGSGDVLTVYLQGVRNTDGVQLFRLVRVVSGEEDALLKPPSAGNTLSLRSPPGRLAIVLWRRSVSQIESSLHCLHSRVHGCGKHI